MHFMTADKWTRKIDEITTAFKKEFGNLSLRRLNWKPNSHTWSIAQNMDHLIVINESYYPVLKQVRENTHKLPWIAKLDFIVNFLGKTLLKAVHPDRRRKTKTFSIWEPSATDLGADIIDKFEKHQSELKKLIEGSIDLVEKGTIISSPANRNIVYKLETAFDIIVTHEQRHFEQAKESLTMRPGN
jgi:DNA-directed RNA polymerase subunit H (RpoH/RPB5)